MISLITIFQIVKESRLEIGRKLEEELIGDADNFSLLESQIMNNGFLEEIDEAIWCVENSESIRYSTTNSCLKLFHLLEESNN